MKKWFGAFLLTLLSIGWVTAQPWEVDWIKPIFQTQLWGTYSYGQEVFDEESAAYLPVDDRFNVHFRRARIGLLAKPYAQFSFKFVAAYDLIGRDLLSSTVGGRNNGSIPNLGIWDARFQYKIHPDKESLYLTAGYFRPQVHRESITSPWAVSSMEKSMSQFYVRRHLVGYGPGGAPGINLGGLIKEKLLFQAGIFSPIYQDLGGNSTGLESSPLFTGRLVWSLGDPESETYKLGHKINYFGKRKGLSIGVDGAWQGNTSDFESSRTLGTDLLFNWGGFNLDGDFAYLVRPDIYELTTGHIRASFIVPIKDSNYYIEPMAMLMFMQNLDTSLPSEQTYDLGLNWYLKGKQLVLQLHYTLNTASSIGLGPGPEFNIYYFQSGLGSIQRGNWLGISLSWNL